MTVRDYLNSKRKQAWLILCFGIFHTLIGFVVLLLTTYFGLFLSAIGFLVYLYGFYRIIQAAKCPNCKNTIIGGINFNRYIGKYINYCQFCGRSLDEELGVDVIDE